MRHGSIRTRHLGLSTDLYELTMAAAFFDAGIGERTATFDLAVRDLPPTRGYLVAAGLEQALAYLRDLRFGPETLDFLEGTGQFRREFLDHLGELRFRGSVHAVPEGTVYFPPAPLLRIRAPIIEAQIVETYLLTTITYQTMIASKAARIVEAAGGRDVVDFSPRRDHGPQAGLLCARAASIGGCVGTSNVLAGHDFGIDIYGTMAHSFVMFHRDEEAAFLSFSRSYPGNPTLLIDTYDTLEGARTAVRVREQLLSEGRELAAVRLDSGDLLELSLAVRGILDDAGAHRTNIFASGNLDEYKIEQLVKGGAAIDGFGVGTELGTSGDAPSLSSTYKLVSCVGPDGAETPVIKLSASKVTLPGPKQLWREVDDRGRFVGDTIGRADEELAGEPQLIEVMACGEPKPLDVDLGALRARAAKQVGALPPEVRRLASPEPYPVALSTALQELLRALQER